ncbi:MAG: ComEC/Rec2 family competence protein [Victivallaceae bacterium]|nr:ComEC/Rec2 family competence protein [Victivallaceae bacterium]
MRRLNICVEPLLAAGAICGAALPLWGAAIAAIWSFLLFSKRNAVAFLLALLAVMISQKCDDLLLFAPHHYEKSLPHRDVYGEFQTTVTDLRLSPSTLAPPGLVSCRVDAMKLNGEKDFTRVSGTSMLRFGEICPPPEGLRCGSRLVVTGRLERPDGNNGFSQYLAARGCRRLLRPDRAVQISAEATPGAWVAAWRDKLLARTVSGLDARTGELAAATLFGLAGGMDHELKRDFLYAGSIHLFSVSGMHVAILAGLLFLLTRPLPRLMRDWPVLAGVLVYTFSTGMAPPAMRASICIAAWCILRLNLLETTPIRLLAFCAAGMLIANPALIGDLGFIYSFTITAALLLAAARWGEFTGMFKEVDAYRPQLALRRRRSWKRRLWLAAAGAAAIAVVAFASGAVISMKSNALLLPGSVAANLLIAPLLPPIFAVWFAKLTLGALSPGIDLLCGAGLTFLFHLLAAIAGGAAELFANLAAVRPGIPGIAVFYTGLLAALAAPCGKIRLLGGAAAMLMLLWWPLAVNFEPPTLMAAGDSSHRPVTMEVAEPGIRRSTAFSMPGGGLPEVVSEFFLSRGIPGLERVIVPSHSKKDAAGLAQLARRIPVMRVEFPPPGKRLRSDFTTAISSAPAAQSISNAINPQKNGEEAVRRFEYFNQGSKLSFILECSNADDGRRLTLIRPGHPPVGATLPYSSKPEIWIYEFK